MTSVKLGKHEYMQKVAEIAEKIAYKHAKDWDVTEVDEFVKLDSKSIINSATEKRNSWEIYDLDGTKYECDHSYVPYAPMP